MTNLLISKVCNLSCSYCFAAPELNTGTEHFISLARFAEALDYLDRSGIEQVRLLGGEPTLHPRFADLVQMVLERGKTLLVFTNGIIPSEALQTLAQVPPDRCIVLVNAKASSQHMDETTVRARRKRAIETLGSRCRIGFTIFSPRCDLEPLIDLVEATGGQPDSRCIRLGLAQPAGDSNRFLHPKQYPLLGERIASFAERVAKKGIRIELDCGFVRCMFSDIDLARLSAAQATCSWQCSPVIDLDIDGTAYHCFPLYSLGGIAEGSRTDAAAVRSQLEQKLGIVRTLGIYEECSGCAIRQAAGCSGGCLAVKFKRASRIPWQASIPEQIAARFTSVEQGAIDGK